MAAVPVVGIVIAAILVCSSASSASIVFATKLPESSFQEQLLKIREKLPTSILERLPQNEEVVVDTEPEDTEPEDTGSSGSSGSSPVNCVGSWSGWGGCSKTCGGGTKTKTWTTTTQPQHGGTACPSPSTQNASCNTQTCPSPSTPSTSTCTSLSNGNYYLTYHNGHKCVGLDDNIICGDSPEIGNDNKFYVECVGGKYTLKSLYNNKYCGGGSRVLCDAGNTTNPDKKFDITKTGNYYNVTNSIGEICNYHGSFKFVCDNDSSNDKRFKFTPV
jgi:hypothetical protein